MKMFHHYISIMRPQQWAKNLFVFIPSFFGGEIFNATCLWGAVVVFFSFSLISSAVYCLNDIKDIDADRNHPIKCNRPIASGELSICQAKLLMCILVILSLSVSYIFSPFANIIITGILLLYLSINIAYCYSLKQYAIIDVFIISLGFVLRLFAGGYATDVSLSPWIVLMTFLLALFLAFAKRRDDIVLHRNMGLVTRSNILRYNLPFMDMTLGIIATITMVCYIIYTVTPEVEARFGSHYVYVTSIFVLAGILRYLQVSMVEENSGSPTKILFADRFIQSCVVLWMASFFVLLYL